jgi:alpha-ketoglutarate-dependent dioxygenase FTO
MEPERRESMALKDEGQFGMGKASVSWHSDSSLQDTSTVAVYHQTAGGIDGDDNSWHIALKCLDDVTPALRVPLNSHETYYMMRDFNMHHHHAVLNGDTRRFSSTHRVAVVAKDTFEYIQGKCTRALRTLPLLKWHAGKAPRGWKVNKSTDQPLSKILHVLGDAHREVEFQWLRMFWLQGTRHASQHETYWAARIEELTQAWDAMELGLRWACDACRLAADGKARSEPRAFEMLRYLLETIAECREEHDARCEAGAYAQVPEDCRPIDLPRFDDKSPLPRDLRPVLTTLELWRRKAFAR